MKKVIMLVLLVSLMGGCTPAESQIDRPMALRTSLLNAAQCDFETQITADFGSGTYSFTMECQADGEGSVRFTVLEPETIGGISGTVDARGGALSFDDTALAFPLLADGLLSPVSGPWILMRALRSGYVRACAREEQLLRVTVDDSYEADALTLDIWLDENNLPVQADIYEENRRIMALSIRNFCIG